MKLPVCFESRSTATAFRSLLDELGYSYRRTNVNRSYSGVAIVIAIERVAMVYRYEIEEIKATADIWEERPNSGNITYIEVKGEDTEMIRSLLGTFSKRLPRKPWEYTLGQKLRNGWFSQGITGAKASWLKVIE
ncbi:MAG: hypothetical protein VX817_01755 [Candidatus Thermoplasmatota archaeon]|nr:hypothetical protein [Candidatus Thermoplasmatota archaeon]